MRGAILATAAAFMGSAMADVAHMRRHGHDSFHQRRNQPQANDILSSSVIGAPAADATCGCTTEVITFYGSPTVVPIETPEQTSEHKPEQTPEPTTTITSQAVTTLSSTSYTTVTVVVSPSSSPAPVEPSTPAETPESSTPVQSPVETPEPSTPAQTPVEPATPSSPPAQLPTPSVTSFTSTGTYTIPAVTMTVTDYTTVCAATSTDLPSGTHTYGGVTTVVETATTVTCPVATVKPSGSTVTSVIETTTYVCPTPGTYTIAPTTTFVPTSTVIVYPTPTSFTPGTYTQPEQTVTATRTDLTYVCPPFTNGNNEPTQPVSPATTTPAAPNTPASTPTNTPTSSPKPPSEGTRMGMTYSPYANDGGCKAKGEIMKDVALIKQKGFTTVRVYGTDCSTLEYVGEACRKNGLKMILGIFIDGSGIEGAQEQVTAITKWAQWDMVTLIVIGNESIQSGTCDAGQLAGFIASAKTKFGLAGYKGKITTAEPINIWQQHGSTLCPSVDVVGANLHPFFNDHTTADEAGNFLKGQFDILEKICPGKSDVINLETGWPSKGNANGMAVPSKENQLKAIKAIEEAFGSQSVFFSYSNDLWKSPGPWNVEQFWGCIEAF